MKYYEKHECPSLYDKGTEPYVVDIDSLTANNTNFRTAVWTGSNLQLTVMHLKSGEDIGLEMHPFVDQFIRIEEGNGLVRMGKESDRLNFQKRVNKNYAIIIPAGMWHNITNIGKQPLMLYSVYAPPEHPYGTVHETKEIAMESENGY